MLEPVVGWVLAAVVAVVGLAVLGLLGLRVQRQVRDLGHEVRVARDRVAALNGALERLTTRRSPPG